MNNLKELKKVISKEIEKLTASLNNEKQIRDNSPSAMESHHDTTRNQTEKLVAALEEQLNNLIQKVELIPSESPGGDELVLWKAAKVKVGRNLLNIILVPESLGGKKTKDFQTLSTNSPLGETIIDMKEDEKFEFNSQEGHITKIF